MRPNISLDVPSQHHGRRFSSLQPLSLNTTSDLYFPSIIPWETSPRPRLAQLLCHPQGLQQPPKGFLAPPGGFSGHKISSENIREQWPEPRSALGMSPVSTTESHYLTL